MAKTMGLRLANKQANKQLKRDEATTAAFKYQYHVMPL